MAKTTLLFFLIGAGEDGENKSNIFAQIFKNFQKTLRIFF
jgi:hypothetical protein